MILILVTDMEMFRVWVEVISAIARIPSPLELWRGACRVTRGMSWVPVVWNSLWSKETRRVELGCVAVPAVSPAGTATTTAGRGPRRCARRAARDGHRERLRAVCGRRAPGRPMSTADRSGPSTSPATGETMREIAGATAARRPVPGGRLSVDRSTAERRSR